MFKLWSKRLIFHYLKRGVLTLKYFPPKELENLVVKNKIITETTLSENFIPRIINQSWMSRLFGRKHYELLTNNRKLNPGYSFLCHTDQEIDNFMNTFFRSHPIFKVYEYYPQGPARVDIFRYCYIYTNGGFWLDIKSAIKIDLISLTGNSSGILLQEGNDIIWPINLSSPSAPLSNKYIANWFFGFTAKHPILGRVIDNIVLNHSVSSVYNSYKNKILVNTGPAMFTLSIHQYLLSINESVEIKELSRLKVLSHEHDGIIYNDRLAECRYVQRGSYAVE